FGNKYLGYVKSSHKNSDIVFMDTQGIPKEEIESKLLSLSYEKKEIIFIPILNSFNFADARIIEIFNARTNMIVLESSLLKKRNRLIKKMADLFLSLLLVPILLPILGIISFLIRKEEPKGSVFFKQKRLGKDGKVFVCYKFRSMREDGDEVLKEYLKGHPEEVESYSKYHKYINDPRITKVGNLLRRTSLDELPQIINVFRGEMSLVGPRPYMLNEKEKIDSKVDMVLAVKPGITGLWQVSGRSDVDFHARVDMDVYYTRNWNLWLDFVVLIKTVKTVLVREGAS
ncbi:MAG: sugar transferase, partial [Campylobacterota bacterium]|nr:sugar transferase [Campylobacterota bacterium]